MVADCAPAFPSNSRSNYSNWMAFHRKYCTHHSRVGVRLVEAGVGTAADCKRDDLGRSSKICHCWIDEEQTLNLNPPMTA